MYYFDCCSMPMSKITVILCFFFFFCWLGLKFHVAEVLSHLALFSVLVTGMLAAIILFCFILKTKLQLSFTSALDSRSPNELYLMFSCKKL